MPGDPVGWPGGMQRRILVVVLVAALAIVPAAEAGHSIVIHQPWVGGHMAVGLAGIGIGNPDDGDPVPEAGLPAISYARIPFQVDACHRELVADLTFEPDELVVDTPLATGTLGYEMQIELLTADGAVISSQRVSRSPALSTPIGTVPEPGGYRVDLYLMTGADIEWDLRVRGWQVRDDPRCDGWVGINEVEADPAGPDPGGEWIELLNPSLDQAIDLSGWSLTSERGKALDVGLPDGTSIEPDGHLVVDVPNDQWIADKDEILVLEDAQGIERDRTQVLDDGHDDGSTQQRIPDGWGAWQLAPGTPGEANGGG